MLKRIVMLLGVTAIFSSLGWSEPSRLVINGNAVPEFVQSKGTLKNLKFERIAANVSFRSAADQNGRLTVIYFDVLTNRKVPSDYIIVNRSRNSEGAFIYTALSDNYPQLTITDRSTVSHTGLVSARFIIELTHYDVKSGTLAGTATFNIK